MHVLYYTSLPARWRLYGAMQTNGQISYAKTLSNAAFSPSSCAFRGKKLLLSIARALIRQRVNSGAIERLILRRAMQMEN